MGAEQRRRWSITSYFTIDRGAAVTSFKEVWRTGMPPKIKLFLVATD
jgi:hypothetical protein